MKGKEHKNREIRRSTRILSKTQIVRQRPRKATSNCRLCGECIWHVEERKPPLCTSSEPLFEGYYAGAWWDVQILKSTGGHFLVHYERFGSEYDEQLPSQFLRLRVRKADAYDCSHFLKPDVDVAVFSLHPEAAKPESGLSTYAAWYDAKLISIDRKHHLHGCACKFTVQFYTARKEDLLEADRRHLLPGTEKPVNIGKIGVLQKPVNMSFKAMLMGVPAVHSKMLPNRCWSTDSQSLQKPVYSHEFLESEDGLLLITDGAEGIGTAETKHKDELLQHVVGAEDTETGEMEKTITSLQRQDIPGNGFKGNVGRNSMGGRGSLARQKKHAKYNEIDTEIHSIETDSGQHPFSPGNCRGPVDKKCIENQSQAMQPNAESICNDSDRLFSFIRPDKRWKFYKQGEYGNTKDVDSSNLVIETIPYLGEKAINNSRKNCFCDGESQGIAAMQQGGQQQRSSYVQSCVGRQTDAQQSTSNRLSSNNIVLQRKKDQLGSASPSTPKLPRKSGQAEMIKKGKSKQMFDDLFQEISKEIHKPALSNCNRLPFRENMIDKFNWEPIVFHEEEESYKKGLEENDPWEEMWQDMELTLHNDQSMPLSSVNFQSQKIKGQQGRDLAEVLAKRSSWDNIACEGEHSFEFDDEYGLVCLLCGFVALDFGTVFSPVPLYYSRNHPHRKACVNEEEDLKCGSEKENGDVLMSLVSSSVDELYSHDSDNKEYSVWNLIPHLEKEMHRHQKEGFEFLWRNIAGGIYPGERESDGDKEMGGCIIAHAPGTGKSFLIISFLLSYLQLFPNCRPLIVVPSIMLHPWQKEFSKWKLDIPVYILNLSHDPSAKRDLFECESLEIATLAPISRDLWRLALISEWHKRESVLIVSYYLFSILTDVENQDLPIEGKKIGSLLLDSPGLLILDEGHFPRNQDTKIRKSLMRVKTKLRILLSGTLFQNNFRELFNTFYLVRPTFMNVLPHGTRDVEGPANRRALRVLEEAAENKSRQLFMEQIGNKLESKKTSGGILMESTFNKLRSMTSSFVHFYAGEVLNSLPGLKDFTLLLRNSPLQEELLNEIAKLLDNLSMLEIELIASNVCIHPSLFCDYSYMEKYRTIDILRLMESREDPHQGVKTRFVLNLAQLCQLTNEKLLVFSQNIPPLILLEEMLENELQLCKGKHFDRLDGKLAWDERQGIVDCFNQHDSNVWILLASLKACGEGISLTGASRVILLDIVWNPAVVKQAISRVFRLGQKKVVYVYRLVSLGTLEEQKYKKTVWKDWLSRSIFVSSVDEDAYLGLGTKGHTAVHVQSREELSKSVAYEDKLLNKLLELDRAEKSIARIVKDAKFLDNQNDDDDDDGDDSFENYEQSLDDLEVPAEV